MFVKAMEIPNYETWFPKTFLYAGKSWVGPYGENLDRNERSMQEFFARLAQKEGGLSTRKVNDSPEPGRGLEWGMLHAVTQPVDIYFASWKKPDDAKNTRGEPIGYFMFIEGEFRWDSTISFGTISKKSTSDQPASPGIVSSSQQSPAEQQSQPSVRVRVEPRVSNGLVLSRVQPNYPTEAKNRGIQGRVNMLAIISKTGEVTSLTLIDGDPLLAPAAMGAVKQWKYHPYMLNGSPVEMETVVICNFALAGKN